MDVKSENPLQSIETEVQATLKTSLKNVREESGSNVEVNNSHRKRHKHYFNAIRSQMEFYFGDANLSKDRFLKKLINEDPFVPLDVFLSFNKIKAITNSVDDISKALTNSILLELEEPTRLRVRRKTEIPKDRNVNEKTLYIESLPPTADHDWIRKRFERFGSVLYVSLPKYAKSKKIKGFAFVEFEHEKSVTKALQTFEEFNGVLNVQRTDPGDLESIKSYAIEKNNEEPLEQDESTTDRCKTVDSEESISEPKAKKFKLDDEALLKGASEDYLTSASEAEDTDLNNDTIQNAETAASCKKRRKRKKSKGTEKYRNEAELNTDASFYELKILPKRDWVRLRSKYLNLQRIKVAEIKRKIWLEKQKSLQQINDNVSESTAKASPPNKKSKTTERKLHKMNMNFYGAGEDESVAKTVIKETKQNPALERTPLFSYAPGLIVEVNLIKPCLNIKELKTDMRQYAAVKYVDVKEGSMQVYIRLENAAAAEKFTQQISCAEYQPKLLTGASEEDYWKKIEIDREMKLNKKVKVPLKRGREKIKKLLTKHIRFGDDNIEI